MTNAERQLIISSFGVDEDVEIDYLHDDYLDDLNELTHLVLDIEKAYEKRYNTSITDIVVVGRLGLWNGNPIGGKHCGRSMSQHVFLADGCDTEVFIEADNTITIEFAHHDGRHSMQIYFLTESKKMRLGLDEDSDYWDYKDYERIYNDATPVKAGKEFLEYYGIKKGKVKSG